MIPSELLTKQPCALWSDIWTAIKDRTDAKAASLARKDLAKLLEIYSVSGMSLVVWAAQYGLYETVQVALESGVHPDDPAIFPTPLLGLYKWHSTPKLTALALKHGASPDTCVVENIMAEDRSPVARYLAQRLYKNGDYVADRVAAASAESLAMLLAAGATTADYCEGGGPPVSDSSPSAAWLIASTTAKLPEHEKRLAALIPLLKAAGADIETPCGSGDYHAASPIIAAVRKKNRLVVEAFIACGVPLDDKQLVHAETKSTKTLFEEIDEAFGPGESSWAREAIMRKVLADAKGGAVIQCASPEGSGTKRRQRMPGV